MPERKMLKGWSEIRTALYTIARLSEWTAKRIAVYHDRPMPIRQTPPAQGVYAYEDELKEWWAGVQALVEEKEAADRAETERRKKMVTQSPAIRRAGKRKGRKDGHR